MDPHRNPSSPPFTDLRREPALKQHGNEVMKAGESRKGDKVRCEYTGSNPVAARVLHALLREK